MSLSGKLVKNIGAFGLFFIYLVFASIQYKIDNEEAIRPLFSASFAILLLWSIIFSSNNSRIRIFTGLITKPQNVLILAFFIIL